MTRWEPVRLHSEPKCCPGNTCGTASTGNLTAGPGALLSALTLGTIQVIAKALLPSSPQSMSQPRPGVARELGAGHGPGERGPTSTADVALGKHAQCRRADKACAHAGQSLGTQGRPCLLGLLST